jgi:dihydroorotate dehydrogenase (NAD+) catalytic subunit
MGVDIYSKKSKLHPNIIGSLIVPCVKPLALRLVYQVVQSVDVPVIGVGGIKGPEDALELPIAGATALLALASERHGLGAKKKTIDK